MGRLRCSVLKESNRSHVLIEDWEIKHRERQEQEESLLPKEPLPEESFTDTQIVEQIRALVCFDETQQLRDRVVTLEQQAAEAEKHATVAWDLLDSFKSMANVDLLIDSIASGHADAYLETVLAAAHGRKRAIRGVYRPYGRPQGYGRRPHFSLNRSLSA